MRHLLRKCGISMPSSYVQPVDSVSGQLQQQKGGLLREKKGVGKGVGKGFFARLSAKWRDVDVEGGAGMGMEADPATTAKKGSLISALYRLQKVVRYVVEDWLFLALLGIIMAILSMAMDITIELLQTWHVAMIEYVNERTDGMDNWAATYAIWTLYATVLVTSSASFVHYVAPQAIGSGIPEMKTILRGVILKEYLTFRTLVSKMVGLTLSLGSGMPIGKEGPFVHIASVVANLLSYMVQSFHGIYANESRSSEMLAAACAVGVSSTFSAPVGGVLFSIEVTSVYFAVRNYWRGFFAAACSATVFRLLRVVLHETEVTVLAFYQTNFPREAFLPEELPLFAFIGILCGFLSAAFIFLQRKLVLFLRRNKWAKTTFQKHWIIYPLIVSFVVASLTFPKGFGIFLAGEKKFSQTAKDFFANCTFTAKHQYAHPCGHTILETWMGPDEEWSVFVNLSCFILTYFFLTILASTLPIPSGIFGPSFVFGGAVGRTIGELIASWHPEGLRGPNEVQIYPGVYAVVGAAAFCGGVTHTVSVAVIVFELTGQLLYILPVMIAVLIANAVCSYLQPSIYDSIIKIKHLPYLPDIPQSSSSFHGIRVEQFMTPKVLFLNRHSSNYEDAQNILLQNPHLKAFPVVESEGNMILIGSVGRNRLLRSLDQRVGTEARQQEANRRIKSAIENIDRRFQAVDERRASINAMEKGLLRPLRRAGRSKSDHPGGGDKRSRRNSHTEAVGVERSVSMPEKAVRRFSIQPVEEPAEKGSGDQKMNDPSPKSMQPDRMNLRRHGLSVQAPSISISSTTAATPDDGTFSCPPSPSNSSSTTTITTTTGKAALLAPPMLSPDGSGRSATSAPSSADMMHGTLGNMIRSLSRFGSMHFGRLRKSQYDTDYDLHGDERREWEEKQLAELIDFDHLAVDSSPFQLVPSTSLFKCGRLVGVVALRDLRIAIEKAQDGELEKDSAPLWAEAQQMDASDEEQRLGGGGSCGEAEGKINSAVIDDDEDEEADIANDIINPRLEVITRTNTAYGADFDIDAYRARHAEKRRTSEVLKNVGQLLAKGALGVTSDPHLANALGLGMGVGSGAGRGGISEAGSLESERTVVGAFADADVPPVSSPPPSPLPLPDILFHSASEDRADADEDEEAVPIPHSATPSPPTLGPNPIVAKWRCNSLLTRSQSASSCSDAHLTAGSSIKKTPSWLGSSKVPRRARHITIEAPPSPDDDSPDGGVFFRRCEINGNGTFSFSSPPPGDGGAEK